MKIMRAGKDWTLMDVRKQNDSGLILGFCMLMAGVVILIGVLK